MPSHRAGASESRGRINGVYGLIPEALCAGKKRPVAVMPAFRAEATLLKPAAKCWNRNMLTSSS